MSHFVVDLRRHFAVAGSRILPGIKELTLKVGLDQVRSEKIRLRRRICRDERSRTKSLRAIPPAAADDVSHLGGTTERGLQEPPQRLRHRRARGRDADAVIQDDLPQRLRRISIDHEEGGARALRNAIPDPPFWQRHGMQGEMVGKQVDVVDQALSSQVAVRILLERQ